MQINNTAKEKQELLSAARALKVKIEKSENNPNLSPRASQVHDGNLERWKELEKKAMRLGVLPEFKSI